MSAFRDLAIAAIIPLYNRARFVKKRSSSAESHPKRWLNVCRRICSFCGHYR
jgi:hypothetical protein